MATINMQKLLLIYCAIIWVGCLNNKRPENHPVKPAEAHQSQLFKDSMASIDYPYLNDAAFPDQKKILQYYARKYGRDTCHTILYAKNDLKNSFENPQKLGVVRQHTPTEVFVLLPFNYCKLEGQKIIEGKFYYFTDTALPRLETAVYCTHPSDIFLAGDIDEDGISEIGQYYSSCSSHYKSLYVWTLKNNRWLQVSHSVFDQHFMKYDRPFSSYVKKIRKGKFAMYEKTDLPSDKAKSKQGYWLKFEM